MEYLNINGFTKLFIKGSLLVLLFNISSNMLRNLRNFLLFIQNLFQINVWSSVGEKPTPHVKIVELINVINKN